jgi:hypothetical protein
VSSQWHEDIRGIAQLRALEPLGGHANDGDDLAIDADLAANDVVASVEPGPPVSCGQDGGNAVKRPGV